MLHAGSRESRKHESTLENISIVIVTYKGDDMTRDCLDSLATTCGTAPQVVVVDNSPSEATRKFSEQSCASRRSHISSGIFEAHASFDVDPLSIH